MENKEIITLIERGFKPESISYEFNVPYSKIQNAILESKTLAAKHETEMDKIRKKYFEFCTPQVKKTKFEFPSTEKITTYMEVEKIIEEIEVKNKEADNQEKKERRRTLLKILDQLKKLDKYKPLFSQLERLVFIIEDKKWEDLASSRGDKINILLNRARASISAKINLAIADEQKEITDLEGLQNLKARISKISRETKSPNYRIGMIDSNITLQIQTLKNQKSAYNLRNNIPPTIEKLVQSIANGTINIKEANGIIAQEAKRRVNLVEKSKFSLNEEQQKRQVMIQIRTLLAERGDIYSIQEPNKVLESLSQLSKDVDKRQLFNIVAQNMLTQRRYDELTDFCDQYIQLRRFDEVESEISKTARNIKKEIVYKKIGDMVVDRIKSPSNKQEDEVFMKLLKDKLAEENIAPTKIKLGRIKGGSKEITLAEIMPQIRNR